MKWFTIGIYAILVCWFLLAKQACLIVIAAKRSQQTCAHKLATTLISIVLAIVLAVAASLFFNKDSKMESWKPAKEAIQVQSQLVDTIVGQPYLVMINILAKANPKVSAWQYIYSIFDFAAHPLVPLGCAVQMYEYTEQWKTWGEYSADGWYLGVVSKHYRCHKIFLKKMQAERIYDIVFFKHKYITKPTVIPVDAIIKVFHNLKAAISNQIKHSSEATFDSLQQLYETLTPTNATIQYLTLIPNKFNLRTTHLQG